MVAAEVITAAVEVDAVVAGVIGAVVVVVVVVYWFEPSKKRPVKEMDQEMNALIAC